MFHIMIPDDEMHRSAHAGKRFAVCAQEHFVTRVAFIANHIAQRDDKIRMETMVHLLGKAAQQRRSFRA